MNKNIRDLFVNVFTGLWDFCDFQVDAVPWSEDEKFVSESDWINGSVKKDQ